MDKLINQEVGAIVQAVLYTSRQAVYDGLVSINDVLLAVQAVRPQTKRETVLKCIEFFGPVGEGDGPGSTDGSDWLTTGMSRR